MWGPQSLAGAGLLSWGALRLRAPSHSSASPHLQLPHLPHISECLMKRSLKPADLRGMTLGQLQVIVNDLHSQIESECWRPCAGA